MSWERDSIPVAAADTISWTSDPLDDHWYTEHLGAGVAAGVTVTPETAIRLSAVFGCVRVLAETVANLPLHVYRSSDGGGKERIRNHEIGRLLHTRSGRPNPWQTSVEFREFLMVCLTLRGNAYAEIKYSRRGEVGELWPIHPDRVSIERLNSGRLRYKVFDEDGSRELSADRILHIRGLSLDGITGVSVIRRVALDSVGLAMAAETHGASFFGNGARPGVVLEHPGKLAAAAASRLRLDWEEMHRGPSKSHRTAVLEGGMKAHELGMSNEDAQFLETRQFQVLEICRIFRVPPHLVFDLSRATYDNIEHQSIEFVQFDLLPWLTRIESAIHRDLIVEDDESTEQDTFVEHQVEGLLRGDTSSRYAAYNTGRQGGWLSVNEIREKENMPPIEGGDEYLTPLNMAPAGEPTDISGADQPPEPDEPDEEQDTSANAKAILAADAAARIAKAEGREIDRRLDKFDADPERFRSWAGEWFNHSHETYVTGVVRPICEAFTAAVDWSEIARKIVATGWERVLLASTAASLTDWSLRRKRQIEALIKESL